MQRVVLPLLFALGACGGEPTVPARGPGAHTPAAPAPTARLAGAASGSHLAAPAPSVTPVVAPALAPLPPPPLADGALGFRPRLFLGEMPRDPSLAEDDDIAFYCGGAIEDVAPLASGAVWVAGTCGVRLRIDEHGLTDHGVGWVEAHATQARMPYECLARAHTYQIEASEREVFSDTWRICGLDPNSVWSQPLQRFDGRSWRAGGRGTSLSQLAMASDGGLWALAQSGPGPHAPPDGRLMRRRGDAWAPVQWGTRTPLPKREPSLATFASYGSLALAADGTVWVGGNDSDGAAVWQGSGKTGWVKRSLDDDVAFDLSAAVDGSIWVAGNQ